MKSVFGVVLAAFALFIVWLWFTGRLQGIGSAIAQGPTPSTPSTPNNSVIPDVSSLQKALQTLPTLPQVYNVPWNWSGPPPTLPTTSPTVGSSFFHTYTGGYAPP